MKRCELCGAVEAIHTHHVVGRVGPQKNDKANLLELCWKCHQAWHTTRTPQMELAVYKIMKARHGDLFPIWVNGRPYKPKWLVRAEGMDE